MVKDTQVGTYLDVRRHPKPLVLLSHNPVVDVASPWQTFTCDGPNEYWARWQQPDDRYVLSRLVQEDHKTPCFRQKLIDM